MTRFQLKNHILLGLQGPSYSAVIERKMLPKSISDPDKFLGDLAFDCGCYFMVLDSAVLDSEDRWLFRPDHSILDRMIQATEEYNEIHNCRLIEMGLAYERAGGAIESSCTVQEHHEPLENGWYDLSSADESLDDEVAYLDSRRLLQRHPEHPDWVTILDEGEPLPEEG